MPRKMGRPTTAWLLAHVRILPNGCWEWTGKPRPDGYASAGPRPGQLVHRISFCLFYGWMPRHHDVDHVCHNLDPTCQGGRSCRHRRCVNPFHLRATTRRSNLAAAGVIDKTVCSNGHDMIGENVVLERISSGYTARRCRECKRAKNRRYLARHGEARNARRRSARSGKV